MTLKYMLNGYELHNETLIQAWLARYEQYAAQRTSSDQQTIAYDVDATHPQYSQAERDALSLMRFELVATSGEAPDLLEIYRETLLKAGYTPDLLNNFPITSHAQYKLDHYHTYGLPSVHSWLTAYEIRDMEKAGRKLVSSFLKALVDMFPTESLPKLMEINALLANQVQPVGFTSETDEETGNPMPLYDLAEVNQVTLEYLANMKAETDPPARTGGTD